MTDTACIGLGSNLGDCEQTLYRALRALHAYPGIRVDAVSPLYASKPVGPQDQPDFLNGAARLRTSLSALQLLDVMQAIERDEGRVRHRHWGERTLDLDLLLFADQQIDDARLVVPHAHLCEREFVLRPLADIAGSWQIPATGLSVADALAACNAQGVWYHGPCNWHITGGHESD
ncbi:MAG: 2-amino-4-hydroxy-6-hydroxymethyldihydropteridine diphosphokinase [Alcanivoracaceae bacterium]|nr:2-amino-4-hydroxy-6-hydroxymethyldihydropteridine diphosphokinase [Alcanivoracaceae bacterium]